MIEARESGLTLPELPIDLTLTRCDSGKAVRAQLVELTAKLAKRKIGGAWWSGLGASKAKRELELDHHWNWAAEIGKHHNDLFVEEVAVVTADDAVQGAMIYRLNGRSILSTEAGAVLIDRLAAAPRNRGWLVENPEYRGAGTNLMAWAAYHSYCLGLGGRLVLQAVPSPRTIEFYLSLGFVETTAVEDDMVVYELEPPEAEALIQRMKATE